MNFAEQPPSRQWANLKYRGAKFAEVWFKPEGEPFALTFRIPRESFHIPGMNQQLTMANLLRAVTIAPEALESWRHGDVPHAGVDEPEFEQPLTLPTGEEHLDIHVRLKPPPEAGAAAAGVTVEFTEKEWQDLGQRWKSILGMEASIDTARVEMENLQAQMEASLTKILTVEEKTHAFRADIARWAKAKNRVRFTLPKMQEFIHRAVWALGAPERKRLAEIYEEHIEPQVPFAEMEKLLPHLEGLHKNRQLLSAQGVSVFQESRHIANEVQTAYRNVQAGAAANAQAKKAGAGGGGKFFKSIRRASGAEG